MLVVSTSHWHHTFARACVDNRPIGPLCFLFVPQLSLGSSLTAGVKELILNVGNPISKGIMALAPYIIENGVSPVNL